MPVKGKDRRTENRCAFIGEMPGKMIHDQLEIQFQTLDVSRKGLGIVLDPCPAEGAEIRVELSHRTPSLLRFKVKHIYEGATFKDGSGQGQRCGIELAADLQVKIDLIEIFTQYPVLKIL